MNERLCTLNCNDWNDKDVRAKAEQVQAPVLELGTEENYDKTHPILLRVNTSGHPRQSYTANGDACPHVWTRPTGLSLTQGKGDKKNRDSRAAKMSESWRAILVRGG